MGLFLLQLTSKLFLFTILGAAAFSFLGGYSTPVPTILTGILIGWYIWLAFQEKWYAAQIPQPLSRLKYYLLGFSLLTYLASLFLPAVVLESSTVVGYKLLSLGWLGLIVGIVGWAANIFAFAALLFAVGKEYRVSTILFAVAFAVGLQALLLHEFPGGTRDLVLFWGPGFYLWECSFLFGMISSYLFFSSSKSKS